MLDSASVLSVQGSCFSVADLCSKSTADDVHEAQNGSRDLPLTVTLLHVPFQVFSVQVYELNPVNMPGVRLHSRPAILGTKMAGAAHTSILPRALACRLWTLPTQVPAASAVCPRVLPSDGRLPAVEQRRPPADRGHLPAVEQ